MIKRVIVLILCLAVIGLTACDPKGRLTREETEVLFAELQQTVLSGTLSGYHKDSWFHKPWESEAEAAQAAALIESAVQYAFGLDNRFEKYGLWFDSKERCRSCCVKDLSLQLEYQGEDVTVSNVSISVYDDGSYVLDCYYSSLEAPEKQLYVAMRYYP